MCLLILRETDNSKKKKKLLSKHSTEIEILNIELKLVTKTIIVKLIKACCSV